MYEDFPGGFEWSAYDADGARQVWLCGKYERSNAKLDTIKEWQ